MRAAEIEARRQRASTIVVDGFGGKIAGYFRKRRVLIAEIPADTAPSVQSTFRAGGFVPELIAHCTEFWPRRRREVVHGVMQSVPMDDGGLEPVRVAIFEIALIAAAPPVAKAAPSVAQITRPRAPLASRH